jgi:Dyp-type peroxidase family
MALTLTETNVTVNETFNEMLEDLQGNILKHHGREVAYHIFVRFKTAKVAEAKKWIKKFAENEIIPAKKQLLDAQSRKLDKTFDGGVFFNLSLSAQGYAKLGIPAAKKPVDPKFVAGMQASAAALADKITDWEPDLKAVIDALIIVSDSTASKAESQKRRIVNELTALTELLHVQKGEILRNDARIGIEHFGYVDGVSQPVFLKEEIDEQSVNTLWHDDAVLNLALVKDPGGSLADSFGSYLVFRKLEQDVLAFKTKEEDISGLFNGGDGVKDRNGEPNNELAGAMIVGRFENGSEVINNSRERDINHDAQLSNDFNYSTDSGALKCPFHAHIRITNPRADIPSLPFVKGVRLVRRGIPFNDIGRDVNDLENDKPTGGVGLLFMCYQANLSTQFEFIQSTWANNGNIGGHLVGQDPTIGQGPNTTDRKLPDQWGTANGLQSVKAFHGFVTNRGGEYFFTPSISFLKSL